MTNQIDVRGAAGPTGGVDVPKHVDESDEWLQCLFVKMQGLSPTENAPEYECGKTIMLNALDAYRDTCKSMVTTCLTAAGVFIAFLGWAREALETPSGRMTAAQVLMFCAPVITFSIAAHVFFWGFLAFRGRKPLAAESVASEFFRTYAIRRYYVQAGGSLVSLSVLILIFNLVVVISHSTPPALLSMSALGGAGLWIVVTLAFLYRKVNAATTVTKNCDATK